MSQPVFRVLHPAAGMEKFDSFRADALKMAKALVKLEGRCMCPTTLSGLSAAQRVLKAEKPLLCMGCGDEVLEDIPEDQEQVFCEDCQDDFDSMDLEEKLENIGIY